MKTRLLRLFLTPLLLLVFTSGQLICVQPSQRRIDTSKIPTTTLAPVLTASDMVSAETMMRAVIETVTADTKPKKLKRFQMEREDTLLEQSFRKDSWLIFISYMTMMLQLDSPFAFVPAIVCIALSIKPILWALDSLKAIMRHNFVNYAQVKNYARPLMTVVGADSITKINILNATEFNQAIIALALRGLAFISFVAALFNPFALLLGSFFFLTSIIFPIAMTGYLYIKTRNKKVVKLSQRLNKMYIFALSRLAHWHEDWTKDISQMHQEEAKTKPVDPALFPSSELQYELQNLAFQCQMLEQWQSEEELAQLLDEMAPKAQAYVDTIINAPALDHFELDIIFNLVTCILITQWHTNQSIFGSNPTIFAKTYLHLCNNTVIEPIYNNANAGSSYGVPLLRRVSKLNPKNNALLCGVIAHENAHSVLSFALKVFSRADNNELSQDSLNEMFAMLAAKVFAVNNGFQSSDMDKIYKATMLRAKDKKLLDEPHRVALVVIDKLEEQGYKTPALLSALFKLLDGRTEPLGNEDAFDLFSVELFELTTSLLKAA